MNYALQIYFSGVGQCIHAIKKNGENEGKEELSNGEATDLILISVHTDEKFIAFALMNYAIQTYF